MKKAKTNKNLIIFLSALLGVVFAFSIGYTFALSTNFLFGSNKSKPTAYLGQQQYTLVNNTQTRPIPFGANSHNVEIALEYAIDYDFDFRVEYSLAWTGSKSTTNVILNFVNRDELIVDEKYIFNATQDENGPCGVPAGEGKINLIASVDFIDLNDTTYTGQYLTITTSVKIFKKVDSYTDDHKLLLADDGTKLTPTSEAAKAWLVHKTGDVESDAYVMIYNKRYNYTNGMPHPGLDSTYKHVAAPSAENPYGSAEWLGGNRAYAGVGLYIITGDKPVTVEIRLGGMWHDNTQTVFDNAMKFNFTSYWTLKSYDANMLHENRYFNYIIPANTSCYLDVLDSIETTSAGRLENMTYLYDSSRLIISEILFNPTSTNPQLISFTKYITSANIASSTQTANSNFADYENKTKITVISTGKYSNNKYEYLETKALQTFTLSSVSLVNNTNEMLYANVGFKLKYRISNGATLLTRTLLDGTTKQRALSFEDTLYYCDEQIVSNDTYLVALTTAPYALAPYSSVEFESKFDVTRDFQQYITDNYDGNFDVYVEIVPVVDILETTATSVALPVRVVTSGRTASIYVKNNTRNIVSNINLSGMVYNYSFIHDSTIVGQLPSNWAARYWQYYNSSNVQNTSVTSWAAGTYHIAYYAQSALNSNEINMSKSTQLYPNEEILLTTFTMPYNASTLNLVNTLFAKATLGADLSSPSNGQTAVVVSEDTTEGYIKNYSTTSYFVRFEGEFDGTNFEQVGDYCYYKALLTPSQIIKLPIGYDIDLELIALESDYETTLLTEEGWNSNIAQYFEEYFNVV